LLILLFFILKFHCDNLFVFFLFSQGKVKILASLGIINKDLLALHTHLLSVLIEGEDPLLDSWILIVWVEDIENLHKGRCPFVLERLLRALFRFRLLYVMGRAMS